jgi:hypothetical protein
MEVGRHGSSISIVSNYRLDNGGSISGRGQRFYPLVSVQTGSEAHLASYPIGTGVSSPGGKAWPECVTDHSPHLVPRSGMSRSRGIFVTECAGTPFQMFFLRRMQTGMVYWNLFFMASV